MERTGATTAAEVIQNLPAMQGQVSIASSVGGSPGGFQGASLHLQGDSRTLVLLNGRRIAPFAGTTLTGYASGVDLATIPLAAIERVEILSDGASALYGADAIGGVINFILRSNYSEGEIAIGGVVTEGGGAGEKTLSVTKGWGDLQKDGYNLLAAFSYNKQDELAATQRDFAKTGYFPLTVDGRAGMFFNLSANGVPANFSGGGIGGLYNPYTLTHDGACPPNHYDIWDTCYFDYVTTVKVFPEMEQKSLLLSGQKKLTSNHTAFADVMVARSTTTSRIAPPPISGFTITPSQPAYQWLIDNGYALDGTSNVKAYWRGMDAGNRTTRDETTATHVVVGVKGLIGAWDYTTSYTHSENQWKDNYTAGWLLSNEMSAALAAGSFNPFLEPGMQTPEGAAAIAGMVANQRYKQATTTLDFIEARGSREIGKIGGGALMLGAGFDYRREGNKYEPSLLAQGIGNNIAGDSANEVPFDLSRNAWGAYAELLAPLTKQLELTGSVRYDKYSDFGDTTNGKLAFRYQPAPNLLFRGSIGTGFKAPTLAQAADIQQSYGVTAIPYVCPFPSTDPLAALCAPAAIQYNMFAGGNPNLKPEESTQWTLGFRVEPTPKFSFGMDLWNVHVKNEIGQITESTIFGDPVKYYDYFTSYNDPLGGPTLAILAVNSNLGQSKARGIDIDTKARFDTKVGKLTLTGVGTYMLDYKSADEFGVWGENQVGKYEGGDAVFRLQARVAATLDYGRFEHTLAVNYKSGYADYYDDNFDTCTMFFEDTGDCLPRRQVSSYLTADWQTKWNINKQATMVVGIRNLLDTNPPFTFATDASHAVGYDPRYTDPRGRLLYVNFNHKF
jgi:iron complex outermembrane receptor protein